MPIGVLARKLLVPGRDGVLFLGVWEGNGGVIERHKIRDSSLSSIVETWNFGFHSGPVTVSKILGRRAGLGSPDSASREFVWAQFVGVGYIRRQCRRSAVANWQSKRLPQPSGIVHERSCSRRPASTPGLASDPVIVRRYGSRRSRCVISANIAIPAPTKLHVPGSGAVAVAKMGAKPSKLSLLPR